MAKQPEIPVDVVELAQREAADVPLAAELGDHLRRCRLMFEAFWTNSLTLATRLTESGIEAKDVELAFHHLWLRQMGALFDEMSSRVGQLHEMSELRIALTVMSRGSDSFGALGKTFTAAGDLLPSAPAQKAEEWPAYIAWMRENAPDKLVDSVPTVHFASLRALCNELAARGAPPPPGVKLSSKLSVKVSG